MIRLQVTVGRNPHDQIAFYAFYSKHSQWKSKRMLATYVPVMHNSNLQIRNAGCCGCPQLNRRRSWWDQQASAAVFWWRSHVYIGNKCSFVVCENLCGFAALTLHGSSTAKKVTMDTTMLPATCMQATNLTCNIIFCNQA